MLIGAHLNARGRTARPAGGAGLLAVALTLQDADFYYEPKRIVRVPPKTGVESRGITTGASYRPGGEMPYRGPGKRLDVAVAEDPTATACRAFIECVRTGEKPVADAQAGLRAAIAVVTANQSLSDRRELRIASTG